ncbi:Imm52 family immunity protein [Nocardioides sp. NPDC127503]|uniref:Imm52 family immunity protein n=1 Tax=Nocardioides sp. NPDC127503 TaxID=3154516 RepID=UPI00331A5128
MDELIARGFWGPRQEPPDQIADKLVAFLAALDDVVGETLRWSSLHLASRLIAEPANALQVISDAFHRNTDAPHLGVTQAYEARGERIEDFSITMTVGGYSETPNVRNTFVLKGRGEDAEALADPILRQLVSVWDPDWAAVAPRSIMRLLSEVHPVGEPGPKMGCLTYLSAGRAQALPSGMDKHLEKLDNGGVVIGSGEPDGFLSVEKVTEFAKVLRLSAAFSPTPTDRSKL